MTLSTPVYQLKRRARLMARREGIALHAALDRVARAEGYAGWSLLSARVSAEAPPPQLLPSLGDGDLLLLGARPGHGKTRLGLQLLVDAARDGRRAAFFTLEYTRSETEERIRSLTGGEAVEGVEVVASDDICAASIVRHLSGAVRGSVAVIDYLQILDQQRSKPPLAEQLGDLRRFARDKGIVLAFVSQIDRSFDPRRKPLPDLGDLRLPNPVDLGAFSKACFLHGGKVQLRSAT